MSFIKQHILKFTPLSPIHIGADETYEPGNYVIDDDNGALYGFDSQAAINGLEEREIKRLMSIVNGKPNEDMLKNLQSFFHDNREGLIAYANPAIPVCKGAVRHYKNRVGQIAQKEKNGKVINKLEIERTFYNPVNNQPLLPGSSIKGAIRTALLDKLNNGNPARSNEQNKKLQERILNGKFHTDPFRLISVGDAHWQGNPSLPTTDIQFAVNRKRFLNDGHEITSIAEKKGLYQLLECITPLGSHLLQGSLQIQDVSQIRQDDKKLPIKTNQWNIKDIARACNAFYVVLLQKELNKLKELNYLQAPWVEKIESMLAQGLLKRMDEGDVFLLRLGRHSGAEAVTLDGVRKIRIMQNNGKFTNGKEGKTWWLAADEIADKTNMLPFGWVLVEIDPKNLESAQTERQNTNTELFQWYQQQQQKQMELRDKAKEKQAIIIAKQEQEKIEQQQLAAQQKLEQQRIASLSPFDQDLEAFLKPIQSQEHDTRLLQALKDERWQDDDAKKIAQIIKELMLQNNKWMPEFSGSNKKKIKLKERSLIVQKYLDN